MKTIVVMIVLLFASHFFFAQELLASYPTLPTVQSVQQTVSPVAEKMDTALQPGDVFISRQYRVRNSHSCCVFAASECVFWGAAGLERFQGIKQSAVENGWRGASMSNVIGALKESETPYKATYKRDWKVLEEAVQFGTGAYVEGKGHALALVGIDANSVRVIDNNGSPEVQAWSRERFGEFWNGCAVFPLRCNRPRLRPENPPEPIEPVKPVEGKQGPAGPKGDKGDPGQPGKNADNYEVLLLKTELEKLRAELDKIKKDVAAGNDKRNPTPAFFDIIRKK